MNPRTILEYTTLALKTLETLLIDARYTYTRTSGALTRKKKVRLEDSAEAIAFIRGTGLELMLHRYEFEIDADTVRQRFFARYGRADERAG